MGRLIPSGATAEDRLEGIWADPFRSRSRSRECPEPRQHPLLPPRASPLRLVPCGQDVPEPEPEPLTERSSTTKTEVIFKSLGMSSSSDGDRAGMSVSNRPSEGCQLHGFVCEGHHRNGQPWWL